MGDTHTCFSVQCQTGIIYFKTSNALSSLMNAESVNELSRALYY